MIEHALVATVFAMAYECSKHKLPKFAHTSAVWFLAIVIVFPVTYITMPPLRWRRSGHLHGKRVGTNQNIVIRPSGLQAQHERTKERTNQ